MANDDDGALDFADVLRDLGHGAANKQASRLIAELVKACTETGGKGTLTLTVKVGAADGLAELAVTAKATVPQPKLPGGSYFATKTGGLVTEDPRQGKLPLRAIPLAPLRKLNRDDDEGGGAS